jgi:hypothetical protein
VPGEANLFVYRTDLALVVRSSRTAACQTGLVDAESLHGRSFLLSAVTPTSLGNLALKQQHPVRDHETQRGVVLRRYRIPHSSGTAHNTRPAAARTPLEAQQIIGAIRETSVDDAPAPS